MFFEEAELLAETVFRSLVLPSSVFAITEHYGEICRLSLLKRVVEREGAPRPLARPDHVRVLKVVVVLLGVTEARQQHNGK